MVVAKELGMAGQFFDFDAVVDGEPMTVPRSTGNLVVLTENDYEEMAKAKRNAEYVKKINRAIMQRIDGTMKEHDVFEVLP